MPLLIFQPSILADKFKCSPWLLLEKLYTHSLWLGSIGALACINTPTAITSGLHKPI